MAKYVECTTERAQLVVIDMLTFPEAIPSAITAAFIVCACVWKLLITKINLSPKEHNFHD